MSLSTVYLGLGSNIDREAHLCAGLDALAGILADQGAEIGRAVLAGEDAIGGCRIFRALGGLRHGDHPLKRRGPLDPGGHRARASRPCDGVRKKQVRDQHDPKRIRYGCFLSDLTGLA